MSFATFPVGSRISQLSWPDACCSSAHTKQQLTFHPDTCVKVITQPLQSLNYIHIYTHLYVPFISPCLYVTQNASPERPKSGWHQQQQQYQRWRHTQRTMMMMMWFIWPSLVCIRIRVGAGLHHHHHQQQQQRHVYILYDKMTATHMFHKSNTKKMYYSVTVYGGGRMCALKFFVK